MTEDRLDRAEERIAHLLRAVDELSDQTRAQAERIARLEGRVAELMRREAERAADTAHVFTNERPPHW